mgnify:CR=1 FL=1
MTFDAANFATGRYTAALNVVNYYENSTVGSVTNKAMLIHNQTASPFGSGWGLADLQRLTLDAQGNALITDGSGRISFFQFALGGPVQDLVVANYGPNNVSTLLGNGDGTFQEQRTFPAVDGPWSLAIGHFNQDAFEDLTVTNYYSNTISVLLGNGDGTFQAQFTFPVGYNTRYVANLKRLPDLPWDDDE